VIRIQKLSKSFGRLRVLDGIELEVPAGQRVALIGANGAGKTTLIRCLLGEYTHGGRVEIGGLPARASRTRVLREVGFVPQLPPALKMPVSQLLAFAADLCRGEVRRMQEVAGLLGLDLAGLQRHPFTKLSGGQKQKLLIAMALGRDCSLLILDEPAANLDPEARRSFFELLADRVGRATMLISSHRLDEVASLVQRVVELDRGRVVLDDRVAESGALDARLRCRLQLSRSEEVVSKTLHSWGFCEVSGDGRIWEGEVPGPDRLRFFGTLARYSGLVEGLQLEEGSGPGGEGR
jgi:ABC-2 type transport system ATP-binding protein